MKVLQINSFFSAGGPPRIMNGIYDTLKENGVECRIAAAREAIRVPEDSYQIGGRYDAYINALGARIFDNDGFAAKKATHRLIKEIERYNPDVIQLHNLHGYYINIELLFDFMRGAGKPVVWTLHDCWPMTGHCPYFTAVHCNRWKTGCHHCFLKKEYPTSLLFDQSERNWRVKRNVLSIFPNLTIVCVSKWLQEIVQESFLSEYQTKVIYNGIDLHPFCPTPSEFREKKQLTDKKLLLGVAMHWLPRKGLNDYIQLAHRLQDDERIILVGLEPGEIKDLPDGIIPIPAINDDRELAKIYSACDVCLNLSYEETFGLTSIEALACGTPIITYDQTAVPEVSQMVGAPIVPAGDINALRKAIDKHFEKYIEKPMQQHDLSVFDQHFAYTQYYKLYKDMTKK